MSTRCNIAFYSANSKEADLEKPDRIIYRHSDGYPTGALPELIPALQQFKGRWHDVCYLSARVLHYLMTIHDVSLPLFYLKALQESYEKKTLATPDYEKWFYDKIKQMPETGYGISDMFHADIDYCYCFFSDGVLMVLSTQFDSKISSWKILGEKNIEKMDSAEIKTWAAELAKE